MTEPRKEDLRVLKTKKAIREAMFSLLHETSLESITVSDLCRRADIRRATFYKHFRDKNDCLEYCMKALQQDFDKSYDASGSDDPLDYYLAILENMLDYLEANRNLFECAVISPESQGFMNVFARQLTGSMATRSRQLESEGCTLVAPPEIIAAFFCGALLGVTKWWFAHPDMEKEVMMEYIRKILRKYMRTLAVEKENTRNER